jgi:hypothetical protein
MGPGTTDVSAARCGRKNAHTGDTSCAVSKGQDCARHGLWAYGLRSAGAMFVSQFILQGGGRKVHKKPHNIAHPLARLPVPERAIDIVKLMGLGCAEKVRLTRDLGSVWDGLGFFVGSFDKPPNPNPTLAEARKVAPARPRSELTKSATSHFLHRS